MRKLNEKYAFATAVAWLVLLLASCDGPATDATFMLTDDGVDMPVEEARGLRILQVSDGYKVEVRNPQDTSQVLGRYHFSRKRKSKTGKETVIRIPVENVALNSTTFVPYFVRMGAHEAIGGVSYANRVTNTLVKAQVDAGYTREISSGDALDIERLLMIEPDAVMAYIYGNSSFENVESNGIPVVMNMEYSESTPLGRAEWVKLVGCMLDSYDQAEALYNEISTTYHEVRQVAKDIKGAPVVFSGSKYERMWFAPGNASFVAQFIRDAGGRYAFQNIEGQGNVQLEFETVLNKVSKADYWGLVVSSATPVKLSTLLDIAPEYSLIKAFREGNVFVCNTSLSDYFGDAVMEPEVILADLVSIIHPGSLPGHAHVYFRPVEVDIQF